MATKSSSILAYAAAGLSVGAHALAALAITALPGPGSASIGRAASLDVAEVAIEVAAAPPPEELAAALPPPETERVRAPRPIAAPEPEAEPELEAIEPPVAPQQDPPAPTSSAQTEAPGLPSVLTADAGGSFAYSGSGTGSGTGTGTAPGATSGSAHESAQALASEAEIRRARREYVRALEALLRTRTEYPRLARRLGHQGRVELLFRVARDGRLLGVSIASSSGFEQLDESALQAARQLSPPAPPSIIPWRDSEDVRAPVVYVLR